MHHQPTTMLHHKPWCKTRTIYDNNQNLIAVWYVTAKKYIQKFWKQTVAGDASLCCVVITLFYITMTLQIMLINVTYIHLGQEYSYHPKGMIITRVSTSICF